MPYIGAPIYIVWLIWFHLDPSNGTYSGQYIAAKIIGWIVYMALIRFYTVNILTSINNYAMIPIAEQINLNRQR